MGCGKSSHQKVSPSDKALAQAVATAQLGAATEKVLEWCSDEQLADVPALLAVESMLSKKIGLKILERKRLLLALGGDPSNAEFDVSNCHFVPNGSAAGAALRLNIRMVTGSTLKVNAKTSQSVLSFKTQVRQLDPFLDGKHFVLVLKGEELLNNRLLSGYDLQSCSELHLCTRESEDMVRDVDGLSACLKEVDLGQYVTELRAWCAQAGAISLDEIRDNAEHVVAVVGFAEAERKKLRLALGVEEAQAEKLRLEDERRRKLAEEEAELERKRLKKQKREKDIQECKEHICSKECILFSCCCNLCVTAFIMLILMICSIKNLGPEEQILIHGDEKRVVNGPATHLIPVWLSTEERSAIRISARDYAVVRELRIGSVRHEVGPQLLFLGAYDTLREVKQIVILKTAQYANATSKMTGLTQTHCGPKMFVPAPLEIVSKFEGSCPTVGAGR